MAKIAIDRAPPTALPRRFLLASPAWAAAAGGLLLWHGADALATRWAPATLALVHALTIGAWGNAMFGSLLQFLPAAAGVRVRGGLACGRALHLLLNLGALLLVAGFATMRPEGLLAGAGLLALAFALLAWMVVPGLVGALRVRAATPRVLPAGLLFAVASGVLAAALGIAMVLALAGHRGLPLLPWVDLHAGWGALGWMLGLLAAVGGVAMPMFQGTHALPVRGQWGWIALALLALAAGGCLLVAHAAVAPLRMGAAACMGVFAATGLAWQWRAPHARNAWLVRSWRVGFLAVLATALALAAQAPALLAGALFLGVAMPCFVGGMQLEIVAFLGWIELTRRCPRGVRLPPVQRLLPEADKAGVFFAQLPAAAALLAAVRWPDAARAAGLCLAASQLLLLWRLHGVHRRVRDFVRTLPAPQGRPHAA